MTTTAIQPASAWQEALSILEMEIPPQHFRTFLSPTLGHQWSGDELVVAASSSFAVSWLTLPLHLAMAEEALARTVGRTVRILYQPMPDVMVATPAEDAPPDARVRAYSSGVGVAEVQEDPAHCPEHPEEYLRKRTRWPSLNRMEQKYEDEIYFCAGDDRECTWVYSMQVGTIVPAGARKQEPLDVLRAYKHRQTEGRN